MFLLNFITTNKNFLQIVGLVLLLLGVYLKGAADTEAKWEKRVAEMEIKVATAEAESKVVNEVIKEKVIEKLRVVKEKEYIIQDRIVNMTANMDKECRVIPEALSILNDAAKRPESKK